MKSGWEIVSSMHSLGDQESVLESRMTEIVALERDIYTREKTFCKTKEGILTPSGVPLVPLLLFDKKHMYMHDYRHICLIHPKWMYYPICFGVDLYFVYFKHSICKPFRYAFRGCL